MRLCSYRRSRACVSTRRLKFHLHFPFAHFNDPRSLKSHLHNVSILSESVSRACRKLVARSPITASPTADARVHHFLCRIVRAQHQTKLSKKNTKPLMRVRTCFSYIFCASSFAPAFAMDTPSSPQPSQEMESQEMMPDEEDQIFIDVKELPPRSQQVSLPSQSWLLFC